MVGPLVDGPVDVPRVDVLLMTLKLIVLQQVSYSYPSKYPVDDRSEDILFISSNRCTVDYSQVDVLLRIPDDDPTVNGQADSPPVNGILNYPPEYAQ